MTFAGRRELLVPPTSLQVATGQVLLVQGPDQEQRSIAALLLTGRARPRAGLGFGAGTISWNGQYETRVLRKVGAPLDVVGANEPEPHMSVGDLVSEELALVGHPPLRGPFAIDWLNQHDLGYLWGLRVDQVSTAERLDLLFELAMEDDRVELLVIDTPDRHNAWDQSWYERLLELVERTDRELAVICLVAQIPRAHHGPVLRLGDEQHDSDGAIQVQHEPRPHPDATGVGERAGQPDHAEDTGQAAGSGAASGREQGTDGLERPLDILGVGDPEHDADPEHQTDPEHQADQSDAAWARPVLHHVPEHAAAGEAASDDSEPIRDEANDEPPESDMNEPTKNQEVGR